MIQSNGCNYCEVPAGHGYHFLKSWSITEAQITKVWMGGVGWPGERPGGSQSAKKGLESE